MRGTNTLRKHHLHDGRTLTVQGAPFATIQGEGPHAGCPATFIRLWGCHLHCYFCDTDFESDPRATTVEELVAACDSGPRLVVITGGEPMRQNLLPLLLALIDAGYRPQIETAGSFWFQPCTSLLPLHLFDFVVSPKTPIIDDMVRRCAVGWKYIMSVDSALDPMDELPICDTQLRRHPRPLARPPEGVRASQIYLQPMDTGDDAQNRANRALCVEIAMRKGYRVSLQLHKILGLP